MNDLAFAAGIMAGEGYIGNDGRPPYPLRFSVSMQDHVSVERVAHAISPYLPRWSNFTICPVHYHVHIKTGHTFARIHIGGSRAQAASLVLWPWLEGTDKGRQMVAAFECAGLCHPSQFGEVVRVRRAVRLDVLRGRG